MRIRFAFVMILLAAAAAIFFSGCAYYNTFYNAKHKFAEAERETVQAASPQQNQTNSGGARPGTTQPRPVPMEKYRKVIETSAKLLELYPKSRWVDDALLLMGISYYRINDLNRAERKFTELVTIFPKSPHVGSAIIWKAQTLSDQKKYDEAVGLLAGSLDKLKSSHDKSRALLQLARLHYSMKQWDEAAVKYRECLQFRQPRNQRMATLFEYGMSLYETKQYEDARKILAEVATHSQNLDQTYNAHLYWARCEIELDRFVEAEGILLRIRSAERFIDYMDESEFELADLTRRSNKMSDAIARYQQYAATHENSELRGLAFFRLANIYRTDPVDLSLAKSLLDSTIKSGASKEIADSARVILDQISKGLLALDRISTLRAQINGQRGVPQSASPVIPEKNNRAVANAQSDSLQSESDSTFVNQAIPSAKSADSLQSGLTPAEIAADSIIRALRQQKADSNAVNETIGQDSVSEAAPASPQQIEQLKRELQLAYLSIAEFYAFGLADTDSAMFYYRMAASDSVNPAVFWKANLALARMDTTDQVLTERYYRAVLSVDSIPRAAVNEARLALGMQPLDPDVPPQKIALREAEKARETGEVTLDSVLSLYTDVIRADSTSPEAQVALFAKGYIYQNEQKNIDSAASIYRELLRLHPNADYKEMLLARLNPPDSISAFNMTDDEFKGIKSGDVEAILKPEKDKSGWPPDEESLRGRRY